MFRLNICSLLRIYTFFIFFLFLSIVECVLHKWSQIEINSLIAKSILIQQAAQWGLSDWKAVQNRFFIKFCISLKVLFLSLLESECIIIIIWTYLSNIFCSPIFLIVFLFFFSEIALARTFEALYCQVSSSKADSMKYNFKSFTIMYIIIFSIFSVTIGRCLISPGRTQFVQFARLFSMNNTYYLFRLGKIKYFLILPGRN